MLLEPFIQKQKQRPRWQRPIFRFIIGLLIRAPLIFPFYVLSFLPHGLKLADMTFFSFLWVIGALIFIFEQK